jgi:hypothetical protein
LAKDGIKVVPLWVISCALICLKVGMMATSRPGGFI